MVLVNSSAKTFSVELYLYCFNILVNLFVLSMCCITLKLSNLKSVKHANVLDKGFYEYVNVCISDFGFSHWKECVSYCVKSGRIRSYSGPEKTKNKKAKRNVLVKSLKNASKIKLTVLHQVGFFLKKFSTYWRSYNYENIPRKHVNPNRFQVLTYKW